MFLHPKNACIDIIVTLFGICTVVIEVQSPKARIPNFHNNYYSNRNKLIIILPIDVTVDGIITVIIAVQDSNA